MLPKVAHVLASLGPGGAEALVCDLAEEQVRSGMSVGIWTLFEAPLIGAARDLDRARRAHLSHLGVMGSSLGISPNSVVSSASRLKREIALCGVEPDLIHTHGYRPTLIARLARPTMPILMTLHNVPKTGRPRWPAYASIRLATRCSAVSETVGDAFKADWGIRASVVPNGVYLQPVAEKSSRAPAGLLTITAVGRATRQKRYDRLLQAAALLKAWGVDSLIPHHIRIVGDGPELGSLSAMAGALGLTNVTFEGFRADVPSILEDTDVFVMSSDYEGLPMALIEALAVGIPCVVTPFGAGREVLGESEFGIVSTGFSAEALAEALHRVIISPELRSSLQIQARERAADFSIEMCSAKYLEQYESVLKLKST